MSQTPVSAAPSAGNPVPAPADFLTALRRLARPGFLCSEFWLVLLALGLLALGTWGGELPPGWSVMLGALLVTSYKYFRAQVKVAQGDQVVQLTDVIVNGASGGTGIAEAAAELLPLSARQPAGPIAFAGEAARAAGSGRTLPEVIQPRPALAGHGESGAALPSALGVILGGLVIAWVVMLLTGCAGTAADTAFRTQVKSVSDPGTGAVSGSAMTTFELRNPSAK